MIDMDELIASLISSGLPWWEGVSDFCGIVAGVVAVAAILVDVWPWIKSDRLRGGLKWSLAGILIVAVTGQIVAVRRVSAMSHEIAGYLNDKAQTAKKLAGEANKLAGEANARAGAAHERAAILEEKAAILTAENIKLAAELNNLGIQVGPREMNDSERAKLKDALKSKGYSITVVMIDNQEARKYALDIFSALQKTDAKVRKEQIQSTSETNVVVCAKGTQEVNLVRIFRSVGIRSSLSEKGAARPEVCDHVTTPQSGSSPGALQRVVDAFFGSSNVPDEGRGTVVLVGQKKPLIINR